MDKLKKKSRAHVVYKLQDGTRIPGTTTITGLLNKPYLIKWANDLGLQGIDCNAYRDELADVGTLAHAMVQAHLQGETVDTDDYSKHQQDLAENSVLSYLAREQGHKIRPLLCETPLVSETWRYGGTVDCYCELDGVPTLLDFKTSKAVYSDYFLQVSAYKQLLEEAGYPVKSCRILRIGREESEGFEERVLTNLDKYLQVFTNLLDIYYLKKELKWE